MHRRIWFLAVAAVSVLALAGAASATAANGFTMAKIAPFAQSWANTPRTPAARAAKSTITVAQEQDISSGTTWNVYQANSALAWAVWAGWNMTLRAPYLVAYVHKHYVYRYDLVTKVVVNHKFIRYFIRKNANWNWGGKKFPVTWKDFVYTVKLLNNPKNNVATNTGVNQIGKATHTGNKIVTFYWKKKGQKSLGGPASSKKCSGSAPCGPYADYRSLLGGIFPYAATKKLNFNTMWAKGIDGSNGKPVSDGPYLMTNYTRGQGVTLKANPMWYGEKPSITTVNFKIITNVNSEVLAIRGGEVDVAAPQPVPSLAALRSDNALNYKTAPGTYDEHIDIQQGSHQTDPLARQKWFRQALMLGINRAGIIKAAMPGIAPGLKPLNSLTFVQGDPRYGKGAFAQWNYNPQKAINLLKAHGCTGGPTTPTNGNANYYTCGGQLATESFMAASDNARRVASFQIIQANMAAIGIKITSNLVPTSVMFGSTGASASNYELVEFAWGGTIDPGGLVDIWGCGGPLNWLNYCNETYTKYMNAAKSQLNVKKRNQDFVKADKITANDVPSIPLYTLPDIVIAKKGLANVTNNPATGFTWNIEQWKWKK